MSEEKEEAQERKKETEGKTGRCCSCGKACGKKSADREPTQVKLSCGNKPEQSE